MILKNTIIKCDNQIVEHEIIKKHLNIDSDSDLIKFYLGKKSFKINGLRCTIYDITPKEKGRPKKNPRRIVVKKPNPYNSEMKKIIEPMKRSSSKVRYILNGNYVSYEDLQKALKLSIKSLRLVLSGAKIVKYGDDLIQKEIRCFNYKITDSETGTFEILPASEAAKKYKTTVSVLLTTAHQGHRLKKRYKIEKQEVYI